MFLEIIVYSGGILKMLLRYWRIFATGLCFTVFGVGGLILSTTLFPVYYLLIPSKELKKKIIRKTISYCFRGFMHLMHFCGLIRLDYKGREQLENFRGGILVANHPTLVDVVAIIAYCENASCIVKKDLWENPFVKGVIKSAGYIPNISSQAIFDDCKQSIENGDVLVIFPEGTRTTPGIAPSYHRGAAHLAIAFKCPIACVAISCDPWVLNKERPWYDVAPRLVNLDMRVTKIVDTVEFSSGGLPRPIAARQLTDVLLDATLPK